MLFCWDSRVGPRRYQSFPEPWKAGCASTSVKERRTILRMDLELVSVIILWSTSLLPFLGIMSSGFVAHVNVSTYEAIMRGPPIKLKDGTTSQEYQHTDRP